MKLLGSKMKVKKMCIETQVSGTPWVITFKLLSIPFDQSNANVAWIYLLLGYTYHIK
jgi:hypothetical protein